MTNKINIIKLMIVLTLLVVFSTGCEDTTITTEIFPDCSFKRTIKVESETNDIFNTAFPIPKNSSWNINKKYIPGKKKGYIYRAEKLFKNVMELKEEFSQIQKSSLKTNINIKIKKHFAWFLTYFTYLETYKSFFPFKQVPVHEYLSSDEFKILKCYMKDRKKFKKKNSDVALKKIEEKFKKWYRNSIFEEFYQILLKSAKQINNPKLKPDLIISNKDKLFNTAFGDYELANEISVIEILKKYEPILRTNITHILWEPNKEAFLKFEKKFRILGSTIGDEYTNKVIMPGSITKTNAKSVVASSVTWKFNLGDFLLSDNKMWAKSYMVNWWAVGISVFLLILITSTLFVLISRRKKGKSENTGEHKTKNATLVENKRISI